MLEGNKIRLRAYTRDDLPLRRAFLNDPELRRLVYPGIPFPSRPEDQEQWYESLDPKSGQQYSFAIETRDGTEYVGCCTVYDIDLKNRLASIGLFIGKEHWRKGYGSDALRVILRFCFREINLNKVALHTYSFNTPAIRCFEKLGFKTEGILRQELYREGQFHDTLAMGVLRSEWETTPAPRTPPPDNPPAKTGFTTESVGGAESHGGKKNTGFEGEEHITTENTESHGGKKNAGFEGKEENIHHRERREHREENRVK